ncbi:MAG: glycine cleavage system protein GcvH [Armatimonadetes bacterium]|nr:glycine cleavage system protein GcvH [Armatimonadota bacterium]
MTNPEDLRYSRSHEWVRVEDNRTTIGITDYAQNELGELVYVELPRVGQRVEKDQPFGVVESVKAVADLYAPVSGAVVAVNGALASDQTPINEDPYGRGWMVVVEMSDPREMDDLMTSEQYATFVASGAH